MSTAVGNPTITLSVNDAARTVPSATTVAELVRDLGLGDRKGVAVAINQSVVPRAAWSTHVLAEGDHVLVIRATQGG